MANGESIRKQVYELHPSDLVQFTIWEHALDEEGEPGQDEATVKPRPDLTIADPSDGTFVVLAELIASDGTRYDGYVYPSPEQDPSPPEGLPRGPAAWLGSIQPTIVTEKGQVRFWYGAIPPRAGELEADYRVLGKTAEQLFPVKFRAVAEHEGARLEGEVRGFMHYDLDSGDVIEEVAPPSR
jgi:hypothetical protein